MTELTRNDVEYAWLIACGVTPATLNDMWMEFLGGLGYTGTLNDRLLAYWLAGGGGCGPVVPTEWTSNWTMQAGDDETRSGYKKANYGAISPDNLFATGDEVRTVAAAYTGGLWWIEVFGVAVPDTDATWKSMRWEGTFTGTGAGDLVDDYTILRADATSFTQFGSFCRWNIPGTGPRVPHSGNLYTVTVKGDL